MKITIEVSNAEINIALQQYATANHDVLKAAVKAYALQGGSEINDASTYELNSDHSITITTTVINGTPIPHVAVIPEISPPKIVPTPKPPLVPLPSPGHMVQVDPPLSITGKATVFGLNYDGADDKGDMSSRGKDYTGFFTDPGTGKSYVTHNKTLRAVSIPREVMLSTFLHIDTWKTEGIDLVWSRNADILRQWVLGNQPLVTIDSGGLSAIDLPICDAGPSADTGHAIDLTYSVANSLNTKGEALATYMICLKSVPMTIRGWDWSAGKIG